MDREQKSDNNSNNNSINGINFGDIKDVSYSICLEKSIKSHKVDNSNTNTDKPLMRPLPRKVHSWVDDETVVSCYNCNAEFSMFLRRHHCRLCGKIYCFECSDYQSYIPETLLSKDSKRGTWNDYLNSYVTTVDPKKKKVCKYCYDLIEKVSSIKKIIDVFQILQLDIKQLKKLSKVCRLWNNASNYCLSLFRELQYKLPTETYSDVEKSMLWNNSHYLSGHNKYVVNLLKTCDNTETRNVNEALKVLKQKKSVNCWSLMCSRNCQDKLTSFDSINILSYCFRNKNYNNKLKRLSLHNLRCSDYELKCYLPMLAFYLRDDPYGLISKYLINRCTKNFSLLNYLYWEIQMYLNDGIDKDIYVPFLEKIKQVFSDEAHQNEFIKLLHGYSFVKVLDNISEKVYNETLNEADIGKIFNINQEFILPIYPNSKIKSIKLDGIKIKNSASRPLVIPCVIENDEVVKIMYKKENMRKDQIILNLIHTVNMIVKKEENIDLNLVDYNILPTGKDSGIVEIVDNAETLYFIKEKLKSSVLNYILELNGSITIKDFKDRFIKSTAAYCVITYLLGVGDRHLDNIMITNDGRLFHIDFGYILGKDPVFSNSNIRITPEIVEVIGGINSEYYTVFKDTCTIIYNCLRRNIDIFMNMLLLLPHISDVDATEKEIKEQLIRRFIPGENHIDAKLHLVKQLEKQNYTDKIKDWCHYHSKERTIGNTISKITSVISELWTMNNGHHSELE